MQQSRLFFRALVPVACLLIAGCGSVPERPLRILTGGIAHESNTFCPILTLEKDFNVRRGEEATGGAEWAGVLEEAGAEIIPTLHARAGPYGVVAKEAYEKFRDEILEGARRAGPVDGVYLEMHGALHAEGYDDAQVDLVDSLREIVGEDTIISTSLDLHGNISQGFVDGVNILTGYRTAPHIDGVETRVRAVRLLLDALQEGRRPQTVLVKLPIIVPGEKGITAAEPLRSIYEQLPQVVEKHGLLDASIFVGMPWTDVPRASMSVLVVADSAANREAALREARRLAGLVWENRAGLKFDVPTASLDEAISTALAAPEKTVFITDSGDNTTAGAAGDTTGVLARLLARGVTDAVVAGILDPEAVETCERAGLGAQVRLTVGGKLDTVFGSPLEIQGTVRFISPHEEEASPGLPTGRSAVLDVKGNLVVLVNVRRSFTAPSHFEEVGIDPLAHKIVVVKLGYLFQALRDIAPRTIMALTPGFAYQLVEELPYENIVRPIYPLDPDTNWSP